MVAALWRDSSGMSSSYMPFFDVLTTLHAALGPFIRQLIKQQGEWIYRVNAVKIIKRTSRAIDWYRFRRDRMGNEQWMARRTRPAKLAVGDQYGRLRELRDVK
ncbi:hypothetical protein G7K_5575-t1 [Saitoella complicata NRRL Y-17804]|uniref:Uncharacterized protein n=1 Tax=Saitoella complicata (strain BCRC 22490 / CBS 7301 / JCM 7358 / NBRC 10748 / NRRL Y-17804) TaxID=698492 RepID=A0A0E9NPX5_SAICN|nr:hypothetical protein G7K_5575-t1 [Saitoella complicata NRRL Y-17804]